MWIEVEHRARSFSIAIEVPVCQFSTIGVSCPHLSSRDIVADATSSMRCLEARARASAPAAVKDYSPDCICRCPLPLNTWSGELVLGRSRKMFCLSDGHGASR